jgi:[ribosomal protein S18]-alanine N-acetyltransferase
VESSAIRLRPSLPSDFDALCRIDQACFPPGIAYGRSEMRSYLRSKGALCLVAEAAGSPGGFIMTEQSAELAHIVTLDVLESCRRMGIGSQLLDAAEQEAAARGARLMYLETATTNKAAIALWKKHGYRETGRIKNYYGRGLDAFEMQKLLIPKTREGLP